MVPRDCALGKREGGWFLVTVPQGEGEGGWFLVTVPQREGEGGFCEGLGQCLKSGSVHWKKRCTCTVLGIYMLTNVLGMFAI